MHVYAINFAKNYIKNKIVSLTTDKNYVAYSTQKLYVYLISAGVENTTNIIKN